MSYPKSLLIVNLKTEAQSQGNFPLRPMLLFQPGLFASLSSAQLESWSLRIQGLMPSLDKEDSGSGSPPH